MKYLITGLGNPGEHYEFTRHNIGFEILDALAKASDVSFRDKRYGFITDFKYKARTLYLLKPSTCVNLSGRAVNYYANKLKIPEENLLVVLDDIALPYGKLRLRPRGGDAGHNGMHHIIQMLGTQKFPRLRFGIGNDFYSGQQADYVLSRWSDEEADKLPERIDLACKIIKSFVSIGVNHTMNEYNNR